MEYIIHLLIIINIYLILAYANNLLVGFSGLLTLSSAVFYGIGAYATTLFMMKFDFSFLPAVFLSILVSGIIAFLVSFPALRFRRDYFVLVTLGLQIIFFTITYNWVDLTNGPYGISNIPRPDIFGYVISSLYEYLFLFISISVILISILFVIYSSPFGITLKSLRDNEVAGESFGKNAFKYFRLAFTISGAISAVAGSFYATYITYIDPTSFTLDESIFILLILLIGGSGNKIGVLPGTVFMVLLPEMLRFVGLPDSIAANMRQIIYGVILILLMYFRPQGIYGDFRLK
ncbi:branched-chain amino acid ABC transporter permease [Persephonella sp.]